MLGQISSCDHVPTANHFSEGCQIGVGDTVSNNVSQAIISLLKIVTERKVQGGYLSCVAKFQSFFLFCFAFIFTQTFNFIKSHMVSAFIIIHNSLNENSQAPCGNMIIGFKNVQNSKMCEISYNILK